MPNDDIVRTSKTKEEEQREGDGEVQIKDELFSRRETAKLGSMVEKALEKDLERQSR